MNTTLHRLHDIVLRTHSTLTDGPLKADRTHMLVCSALGLAGESGEYVDMVKKLVEQNRVLDKDKAALELFDVAYYLQLAVMALDTDLSTIVDAGCAKLNRRFPNGFTPADALSRKDVNT